MKKSIFVRFQLSGVHCWPDANIEQVMYLANTHRHMFYFEVKVPVTDSNREVEFVNFQYKIKSVLLKNFWNEELCLLDFEDMSCEMIAEFLLETFPESISVRVFEDNENGAEVER